MARGKLSFTPKIAKPCEESWAEMQGGSRERHCELCNKQVHNFAAMTAREIEKLALERQGKFCARMEYREDGSLVTLDEPKRPVAAHWITAASLAMSAAGLAAQAPSLDKPEAVLTGKVVSEDGSTPRPNVFVLLRGADGKIADTKTLQDGSFKIVVEPGVYDIDVNKPSTVIAKGITIPDSALHSGFQSVSPISLPEVSPVYSVMVGEVVGVPIHGRFVTALRHPLRFGKYLWSKL